MKKFWFALCAMTLLAAGWTHAAGYEFSIGVGAAAKRGLDTNDTFGSNNEKLKGSQRNYDVRLGWRHLNPDSVYGELDLDFRGYSSEKLSVGSTKILDGKDYFYNAQIRLGYAFGAGEDFMVTPFIGIGSLSDRLDLAKSATLATDKGYFVHKSNFGTLGVRMDGALSENWDLGVLIQATKPISDPKMKTNLTADALGVTGNLDWRMKKKINYSVEVPITYNFSESSSSLRVTPFFETLKFGKMSKGPSLNMKSNMDSHLWGARLEYVYRY